MKVLKMCLGILLIFCMGALAGAVGSKYFMHKKIREFALASPEAKHAKVVEKLSRKLNLTEAQKVAVEEALSSAQQRIIALKEKNRPELENIFSDSTSLIKKELNAEQMEKFDSIIEKIRSLPFPGPGPGFLPHRDRR